MKEVTLSMIVEESFFSMSGDTTSWLAALDPRGDDAGDLKKYGTVFALSSASIAVYGVRKATRRTSSGYYRQLHRRTGFCWRHRRRQLRMQLRLLRLPAPCLKQKRVIV